MRHHLVIIGVPPCPWRAFDGFPYQSKIKFFQRLKLKEKDDNPKGKRMINPKGKKMINSRKNIGNIFSVSQGGVSARSAVWKPSVQRPYGEAESTFLILPQSDVNIEEWLAEEILRLRKRIRDEEGYQCCNQSSNNIKDADVHFAKVPDSHSEPQAATAI